MKKLLVCIFIGILCFILVGCNKYENNETINDSNITNDSVTVKNTIEGSMNTYNEMSDGTWMCDGHVYKYRLEISGRMPNADKDTTYIYLSNIENIPFTKAYIASGISSNLDDYFSPEEAVLVEMN